MQMETDNKPSSKWGYDLGNAKDARQYISEFRIPGRGPLSWMRVVSEQTGISRRIEFATMSDDDAIQVAMLLYEIECEREAEDARL